MWRRVPLRPTAIEAAAMTVGPMRNLTAIANVATEFPQAIIFGCRAINKPFNKTTRKRNNQYRAQLLLANTWTLGASDLFTDVTAPPSWDRACRVSVPSVAYIFMPMDSLFLCCYSDHLFKANNFFIR